MDSLYKDQSSSIRRSNRKRKMKTFDDYEVDLNIHANTSQAEPLNDLNQTGESELHSDKEQTTETDEGTFTVRKSYRRRQTFNGRKRKITKNLQKSQLQSDDIKLVSEVDHPAYDDTEDGATTAGGANRAVSFLYKCVTKGCSKRFKTTRRLRDHKKQYHGESLRFICACCDKGFATLYTGRSHLRMDHSNTLAVEFTIENTQVLRVKKTGIEEGNLLICTKCGFGFSGNEVPNHNCESVELQYYCPCCDFHSKVEEDMQQHLILTDNHNGDITEIKHIDKYVGLRSSAKEPGLNVDQDITVCELCGAEFISNKELKLHLNMKHAYLPFACGVCKTCYGRKAALKNHMVTHTKPKLKCSICDKEFHEKYRLDVHVATHSGNKQHQCDICGNRYCDERSVKKHIIMKHQRNTTSNAVNLKRKSLAVCHLCGKTYQSVVTLNKHLKLHKNKKQFNCPFCEKSFKEFKQYREHKLTHQALDFSELGGIKKVSNQAMQEIFQAVKIYEEGHASGMPHKCNLCNKRFHTEKRLHGHIRVMHMRSEDKSFICKICNKGFTSGAALRTHTRLHDNTKPYRCRICHKRFRQLGHIKDHLLHHGKANVQCTLCKKMLKSRGTLRRHVVIHCKIFPYKCPVKSCKESFLSLALILDHFKECSSSVPIDTPLKCSLCDQSFTKSVLTAHYHLHETDLNFPCSCGMSFTTYPKLYFHKDRMKHFEASEFESPGNNNPIDRLEQVVDGVDREELLMQFDYIEERDEIENASDGTSYNNSRTNANMSKVRDITVTDEGELLCIAEQLTNMASGVIIQTADLSMNGEVVEISFEEVEDNKTEESQVDEVILYQNSDSPDKTDRMSLEIINVESGNLVRRNEHLRYTENYQKMTFTQDTTTENIKHENDGGQGAENNDNQDIPPEKQITEVREDNKDIENDNKIIEIENMNPKVNSKVNSSPIQNLAKDMLAQNFEGQTPIKDKRLPKGSEKRGLGIHQNSQKDMDMYEKNQHAGNKITADTLVTQCDEDYVNVVQPEQSCSTDTVKSDKVPDSDLQKRGDVVQEFIDCNHDKSFEKSLDQHDCEISKSKNRKNEQEKLETTYRGRQSEKNQTNAENKSKIESDFCNEFNNAFQGESSIIKYDNINSDLEHDLDEDWKIETNKRKAKRKPKVKKKQSITREYSSNKSSPQLKSLFMQQKVVYGCTTKECSKKLLTLSKMQIHKKLVHKENMKHICTVCEKEFGTFYVFKSHIRMEHSDLDFVPFSVKNVDVVIKELTNKVGKEIQVCTKCGYRRGELEDAAHTCNRMELLYYCPCLEFTSDSQKEIRKHIAENHQGAFRDISNEEKWASLRSVKREPEYKVEEPVTSCESFNTQKEYKRHLNSEHVQKISTLSTQAQFLTPLEKRSTSRLFSTKVAKITPIEVADADHPFACGVCYACYGRKSAMVKHMLGHKREYKCSMCNKGFYEKTRLDTHMLTHNGQKPSQCELCGNRYCEEKNLKKHIMLKHPDYFKTCWPDSKVSSSKMKKVSSVVCHVCGTLCATETRLKSHVKKHHTEAYKCPDCGKAFNDKMKFKKHKLSHQTIDLSNTCDNSSIKEVKIYEEDHPSGRPFKCGLCEKRFANLNRVQRHIQVIHLKSEDKKFVCHICKSGFVLKAALRTHMRMHNNSKPYRCRLCQKQFRQLGHIKDHLLHHGKPHLQCALCKKKFKSKGNLNRHIQVHCKIFPFRCPKTNCSAAFQSLFSFLSHSSGCLESVNSEQYLTCNFCQKSFKSKNIISHYHTHENDVKYPCTMCNMSFESYKGLYFHKEKLNHFEELEYDGHCNTKLKDYKIDSIDGQTQPGEDMSREELLRQYDYLDEDDETVPEKPVDLAIVKNEVPAIGDREIVLTEEQLSELSSGVVYAEDVEHGDMLEDTPNVVEIKLNEDVKKMIGGDIANAQVIINNLEEFSSDNQVYAVSKPGTDDVSYYILQLDETDS